MVIIPTLHDADGEGDLGGNFPELPPEALLPVGVVGVGMGDPVAIPVQSLAPQCFIHLHLRTVSC